MKTQTLIAIVAVLVVMGSVAGGAYYYASHPSPAVSPSFSPQPTATPTATPTSTAPPTPIPTVTLTATPTSIATPLPTGSPPPTTISTPTPTVTPITPIVYEILNLYPEPNSENVSVNTEIHITFSTYPPVVNIYLNPKVRVDRYGYGGKEEVFVLAEPLQLETTYTATVTYGEEEVLQTFTWNFTTESTPSPQPTHVGGLFLTRVFLWEDGVWKFVGMNCPPILIQTLDRINYQVDDKENVSIRRVEKNDVVAEIVYRFPTQVRIGQNTTLENVTYILFILKDNLDEGLEAHILVSDGSCWAIRQEESKEIDKSWTDEVNRVLKDLLDP